MRSLLMGALVLGCQGGHAPQGQVQDPTLWGEPRLLFELDDPKINESSGIAPSRLAEGIYYTHNDGGDLPRFFKFNMQGKVLARCRLAGAENVDWEDMASARIGGKSYLYLGDIGDNDKKRKSVVIYRVDESMVPAGNDVSISKFDTYTLTYPDGPRDAETLMVHPRTGDIYIVEKVKDGASGVYKLPSPQGSGSYKLERIGQIEFAGVIEQGREATAGDISPDGRRVVIRTYLGGFEWWAPERFDDWVQQPKKAFRLAFEIQGESICFSVDGKSLLTTSEGAPCRVSQVPGR
jgi:hypothetical protein